MLNSSIGRKIASLTQQLLFTELINDAYKPKMHKIYSLFLRGVKVDFALNIRKSPFSLKWIEQEVRSCLSVNALHMTSDLKNIAFMLSGVSFLQVKVSVHIADIIAVDIGKCL